MADAPIARKAAAGTLKKVVIITRREMLGALKSQMDGLGISGMTISYVEGFGAQKGHTQTYRGVHVDSALLPKMKAEIVVSKIPVQDVVEAAKRAIYTGAVGDGKIFIYDVENAFRIRTGQSGADAGAPSERCRWMRNLLRPLGRKPLPKAVATMIFPGRRPISDHDPDV